jgi:hypothetical protein
LPAADRELADPLIDIDVGPDRGEALARGAPHRAAVKHAPSPAQPALMEVDRIFMSAGISAPRPLWPAGA